MCCMCVAELIIKERSYFLGDPSKTELMRLIRCFGTHIIPIHINAYIYQPICHVLLLLINVEFHPSKSHARYLSDLFNCPCLVSIIYSSITSRESMADDTASKSARGAPDNLQPVVGLEEDSDFPVIPEGFSALAAPGGQVYLIPSFLVDATSFAYHQENERKKVLPDTAASGDTVYACIGTDLRVFHHFYLINPH